MKMYIYINEPVDFLAGDFENSLNLSSVEPDLGRLRGGQWPCAGEVDVYFNVDRQTVTEVAVKAIEEAEQKERADHQYKMDLLKEQKQKCLSISHDKGECNDG